MVSSESWFVRHRLSWRAILAGTVAVLIAVVAARLLWSTSGIGGTAAGLLVGAALTVWRGWSTSPTIRRRIAHLAIGLVVVGLAWNGVTLGRAVAADTGETFSQKATTWGRDHGLGWVINWLETQAYSDRPSATPANELALDIPSTTAAPTTTEANVTTTTIYTPPAPADLAPIFDPPLENEGHWMPVTRASGVDAMWATSLRPVPSAGSVVASIVVIDQTYLRAGMFNGREPAGNWARDDRIPSELWPALRATMNGGFRLEHTYGGYMTEGVVVQDLIPGRATMAIGPDGKLVIGELGRDIDDDGHWLTLRQNLVLMVDRGQSGMDHARQEHVYWGAHSSGELFVNRSAVCTLTDGRLMYVMAGRVDPAMMIEILIEVGCYNAVQLDINGAWPDFALFYQNDDDTLSWFQIDRRMSADPKRYLEGTSRDFFAFFDATQVPAESVLDR